MCAQLMTNVQNSRSVVSRRQPISINCHGRLHNKVWTRGVQVAVRLGSYFGTIWLKISEKFVVTRDEHRPARQNVRRDLSRTPKMIQK